jgi:hypothetical protein
MPKQNSSNNSARSDRKLAKALREAWFLLECELDNKLARAAPQGTEAAVTQYDRSLAEFHGLMKGLYSDQHDKLRAQIRARSLVWQARRQPSPPEGGHNKERSVPMSNEIKANVSRRRRPPARLPGLRAALEAMEAEDAIVRELCDGLPVSAVQAAASVELARTCAAVWADTTRRMSAAGSKGMVYQLHAEDFQWLDRAAARVTAVPDPAVMRRLDEIVGAVPFDAAAVASLNAARWITHRYEMHLH